MSSQDLITEALQANFRKETDFTGVYRHGVLLNSSTYEGGEDEVVTDQWIASTKVTAGQEIVSVNGRPTFTRIYIGGVIPMQIQEMGLTESQVLEFLEKIILEHGGSTRLDTDFTYEHGNWSYYYRAERLNDDLKLMKGAERIYYTGKDDRKKVVFLHHFMFAPIIEG